MSEARFCDKCGNLFAGPPAVVINTPDGELELGSECAEAFYNWFSEEDADDEEGERAKPTSQVS